MRRSIVCHDFNALRRRDTDSDRQTDAHENGHRQEDEQIDIEAVTFVSVSKKHQRHIYFCGSDADSAAATATAAIRPFSRHQWPAERGQWSGQCSGCQWTRRQAARRDFLTTLLVTVERD